MTHYKQICQHFSSRGSCRFGDRCRYAHDSPSGTRSTDRESWARGQTAMGSLEAPIPFGVCQNFWKHGHCRYGCKCRYDHVRPQERLNPEDVRSLLPGVSGPLDMDAIAPFLTEAGLAKISGSSADIFSSSVGQKLDFHATNYHLKRYLHDDFRFQNAAQIHTFVSLLSNASSENKNWVRILPSAESAVAHCHICVRLKKMDRYAYSDSLRILVAPLIVHPTHQLFLTTIASVSPVLICS